MIDNIQVSRFLPLKRVLAYDVFNEGFNGWMVIMPNFCNEGFEQSPSIVSKDQWPSCMLSTATFRYPGSHGSMSGQYSLKISTRNVCSPYASMPAPGSMGHGIKRISFFQRGKYLQFETWFAYTAEQDTCENGGPLPGLHENSVRSFGFGFDLQERGGKRRFAGVRYLNAVDGKMMQKWQMIWPWAKDDKAWAYDTEGDWCVKGVDPFWNGKRYPDGRHEGFIDVPDGHQELCYNETDCKLNWQYFRLLIDTEKYEYVEMQCQDKVMDLGRHPIYGVEPYARIEGLMNPLAWVETDAPRRAFLYLDSVVVSQE